ncbi:MAG: PaaI family thioesterase [Actinomycetaceae bacterium]|nr:PaaI family thioesterase [Actinomycetaceae bacterium]
MEITPDMLMHRMEMEVVEVTPTKSIIRMPVEGNRQTAGYLHGGATAALAETAGSFSANAHAQTLSEDSRAVGVELSIQHISSAKDGFVTATATAVHLGRTRCVHRVEITDEGGKTVSVALISNQIIRR